MDLISGHSKLWRELLGSFQSPSELKKEEWKNQGEEFQTRGLLFKSQLGYNEGFRKDRNLTDVLNMTSSATLHKVSHEMEETMTKRTWEPWEEGGTHRELRTSHQRARTRSGVSGGRPGF